MMRLAPGRGMARPICMAATSSLRAQSTSALRPCIAISNNITTKRYIHSSEDRRTATLVEHAETLGSTAPNSSEAARAPLSVLPMSMILRSLATTTVSSSSLLLPPSLRIMSVLAHTTNPLLNPDKNPLLRFFLKKTFYAQFCAGETSEEVRKTIANLKNIGFTGVILGYAREVVLSDKDAASLAQAGEESEECIKNELIPWAEGTLETVRLASPGDFVAMKFTGAGRLALAQLQARLPASPSLYKSVDSICQLAHERGVRLLFDAEQDLLQPGIDHWAMEFSRKYNKGKDQAVVFNTYQSYKKCIPKVVSEHLAMAQKEGFALGVKLVRGAYLGSDPRELFHDTKADTDACYDGVATSVLTRQWGNGIEGQGAYPPTSVVLATHNAESVGHARAICDAGEAKSDVAFAQLQGMADEVSCELVEASLTPAKENEKKALELPAFKYLVWGTTGECMKYLLRRAHENKDAVQRTQGSRDAMWGELIRRSKSAIGLA